MGLDQSFYEVREGSLVDINLEYDLYYFRKNWDLHYDLEEYFDTNIINCEYFIFTIDDIKEMVKIKEFFCLRPLLNKMNHRGLSKVAYQAWW